MDVSPTNVCDPGTPEDLPAILIGRPGAQLAYDIEYWLKQAFGLSVGMASCKKPGFHWLSRYRDAFSLVLIDAEACEDLDDVIDQCLTIREAAPHLPIILMDSRFSRDDLGPERRAICDCSLRLPLSRARLIDGVRQAVAVRKASRRLRRVVAPPPEDGTDTTPAATPDSA